MTAVPGPRHAAHRRARHSTTFFPATRPLPTGGAHRARHARKRGLDRYDRAVLAVAGWLLTVRIALVGEHVIDEM
ncbi:hypothetical protein [Nocardia veterana]|uniref:Uncharacterized protein n=1 Tax=Nocardia veterana TaxID=132249 RepID=A0A7X6RGX2_9NOCA|nr:hypothetical protein [Nocardia veterana]NKY85385.1 hypothetical protein [Nocardia veterana]